MATNFVLLMKEGPDIGQRTPIAKSSFVLGREPSCDLPVNDVEVSRRHARLIAQSGGHAIEDLGSTNGTFVNGQRIRTVTVLRPGDKVRIGEIITFVYEAEAVPAASPDDINATPPSTQQLRAARSIRAALGRVPELPAPQKAAPAILTAAPMAAAIEAAEAAEESARPSRLRPRRKGIRLPILSRRWMIGCAVFLLLGVCAGIFFFWYVDANYLWCDVFGGLISACR